MMKTLDQKRKAIRNAVEKLATYPLATKRGKVLYLKVTLDDLDRWTISGMKEGQNGNLVQDGATREFFEGNSAPLGYLVEALSHLSRDTWDYCHNRSAK